MAVRDVGLSRGIASAREKILSRTSSPAVEIRNQFPLARRYYSGYYAAHPHVPRQGFSSPDEHWRNNSKLPAAKRNVARRHRKAHWTSCAATCHGSKTDTPSHHWIRLAKIAGAMELPLSHSSAESGHTNGNKGLAATVRRRSTLPEPDPPLLRQPERQRPQTGARHGQEDGS